MSTIRTRMICGAVMGSAVAALAVVLFISLVVTVLRWMGVAI